MLRHLLLYGAHLLQKILRENSLRPRMKVHSSEEDWNLLLPSAWRDHQFKANLNKIHRLRFIGPQIWEVWAANLCQDQLVIIAHVSLLPTLLGAKVNILAFSCRRMLNEYLWFPLSL